MFNVPNFTQGDRITWYEELPDLDPLTDTLSCFIRGVGSLDLTAFTDGDDGVWQFEISSAQSQGLPPGKYKAQFTVFYSSGARQTLGVVLFDVAPDLAALGTIDNRNVDEIELEKVRDAIASGLSDGVAEYEIGERKVKYHSLDELYKRERYLLHRIAKRKDKSTIGGRNVGVRFE